MILLEALNYLENYGIIEMNEPIEISEHKIAYKYDFVIVESHISGMIEQRDKNRPNEWTLYLSRNTVSSLIPFTNTAQEVFIILSSIKELADSLADFAETLNEHKRPVVTTEAIDIHYNKLLEEVEVLRSRVEQIEKGSKCYADEDKSEGRSFF